MTLQKELKPLILTPFMTRFTKWQRTKPATAEHSKDFLTDTSVNNPFNISLIKAAPDSGAAFAYHFIEFRVLQSNKKIR